jgi:hypothetical protein
MGLGTWVDQQEFHQISGNQSTKPKTVLQNWPSDMCKHNPGEENHGDAPKKPSSNH